MTNFAYKYEGSKIESYIASDPYYFHQLACFIKNKTNLDVYNYADNYVKRRLNIRILEHKLAPNNYKGYLKV